MADFSPAAFLSEVLRLTARDGNVAVLPEVARFASGGKPVLRIVVPSIALDEYLLAMDRVGVSCAPRSLTISSSSGTWNQISAFGDSEYAEHFAGSESVHSAPAVQTHDLTGLYISLDLGTASAASLADVHDSNEAGLLFGYPVCCVANVEELADAGADWPQELVKRSGEASRWNAAANRIVADWGGIPPIGELFPCSLSCQHAAHIGRSGVHALEKVGLFRLAERIMDDATRGWRLELGRAVPSSAINCYRLTWQ